jgi:hypothetical protein
MLEVLISKDTWIPSKPWRIDLITPKGKCHMSSHATKKGAIACVKNCSPNTIITDAATGKIL